MTMRRQRREDPAYLTAMREAKELFDAEMAKNSMKGRGRPKTVVVAAPATAAEVENDHEVSDEIADLASDEAEVDVEGDEVAPSKTALSSATSAPRSSTKSSRKSATRGVKKPVAKRKAAPTKKAAARKR